MNSSEVLLFSQLASLTVEGITALVQARRNLAANADATETANLDQAHENFQKVIANAAKVLNSAQPEAA